MKTKLNFVVSLAVFLNAWEFITCAHLPPTFQRCSRKDADFMKCIKVAMEDAMPKLSNGLKELSLPVLEPVNVPSATIKGGTGPVNVEQKYTNIDIHKVTTSKVDMIEPIFGDEVTIKVQASAPEYILKADYDFNGRILLLPIVGVGKCTIVLSDVITDWILKGKQIEKKGVRYLEIQEFKVSLRPGKVYYNFENLFNGDQRLGSEMNKVLNENWKEVFDDVKIGYEEMIGSLGKVIANQIFTKVPFDEIFLP